MSDVFRAYFDESGNSGMNYLDEEQPFFGLGAIVVRASKEASLVKALREESQRYGGNEIKSTTMLRRSRGRRTAVRIVRRINEHATPMFAVHYKRFALGGRLVDEFLDFENNPEAPEEIFRNKELRRSIAATLGELSTDVLQHGNEFLRSPSAESEAVCIGKFSSALRADHPDLAEMFAAATGLIWRHTATGNPNMCSPNIGAFMTLASLLEGIGQAHSTRVELIHDQQLQFADVIRTAQRQGRDPHVEEAAALVSTRTGRSFRRLVLGEDVVFSDSRDELLLQAADVWTGAAVRSLRKVVSGERWEDDAEAELAVSTLGGSLADKERRYFNLVLPGDPVGAIAERVNPAAKRLRVLAQRRR